MFSVFFKGMAADEGQDVITLTTDKLSADAVSESVTCPSCGAISLFIGQSFLVGSLLLLRVGLLTDTYFYYFFIYDLFKHFGNTKCLQMKKRSKSEKKINKIKQNKIILIIIILVKHKIIYISIHTHTVYIYIHTYSQTYASIKSF